MRLRKKLLQGDLDIKIPLFSQYMKRGGDMLLYYRDILNRQIGLPSATKRLSYSVIMLPGRNSLL